MIYLKTIFSAPNEIKYLKLNLREASNYIDKMIICEFNRTHTGQPRNLIFKNYLNNFSEQEKSKIIYIGADLSDQTKLAINDSKTAHKNERLMRGYFVKEVPLQNNDIIFSVDADEIIYKQFYNPIIKALQNAKWPWQTKSWLLPLQQFFYKINYLWENLIIDYGPVACRAEYFLKKYPAQWRGKGKKFKSLVGAHFSWCLTTEEMITKLHSYAHNQDYGHLANKDILEDAIKNKTYPFDPSVNFKIKILDLKIDKKYFPASLYNMLDDFKNLIAKE